MALSDALVAYYPLDEASGNAIDAHGSNDLTDNNTVGIATGKVSGGRDFERDNSEYFSHTGFSWDTAWSIAFWCKPESLAAAYAGLWSRDNSNFGARSQSTIYLKSNGKLAVYIDGTINYDGTGSQTLSAGNWHFIVFSYSPSTGIVVYVNDVQDADTSDSGTPSTASVGMRLGDDNYSGEDSGGREFDGVIDECGIWLGRTLDSSERTELYNSGNGRDYAYITAGAATNRRRRIICGAAA